MGETTPTGEPPEDEGTSTFQDLKLTPKDLRDLFYTFPMPVWLINPATLAFLETNPAAVHLYGYSRDQFLSKKVVDIFQPEDAASFVQMLSENRAGFVRGGMWRHRSRDGRILDMDLVWCSFSLARQPCQCLMAFEMTERRWAEQLLTDVHTHTEEQLAARTMEMDVVAQEIESFAQALLQLRTELASAPEQLHQQLELMSSSLRQLNALTYVSAHLVDVDLSEVARTAAFELQQAYPGLALAFRIMPGVRAHADPKLMHQVFTQLFRNALVHTPRGSSPTVEFGARIEAEELICFVYYAPAGLQSASSLLLPFQGAHPEMLQDGIGLSIVRRIVTKHAGRIWTSSSPDSAAAICFSLPLPKDSRPENW
jgi:PAS domain S-box-containing protein